MILSQNFKKGETNAFMLTSPFRLGTVTSLRVWHDSFGDVKHRDWYLSKIVLFDHQLRHMYVTTLFHIYYEPLQLRVPKKHVIQSFIEVLKQMCQIL